MTTRLLAAWGAAFVTMLVIDGVWLGVVAKNLYRDAIGHLMADQVNFGAAAVFYVLYPIGVVALAVVPNAESPGWTSTLVAAAIFGFIAYATYDLTNLATLKGWPVSIALIDMAWGTAVTVAMAAAARWAYLALRG